MMTLRAVKFAAAIVLALGAAACSSNKDGMAEGRRLWSRWRATPGSAQDFVVNVGDRVFFETDQTDLTPTADRDPRQAGAVALPLSDLHLPHRRSCGRARHPRIQLLAQRAPRPERSRLPRLARHPGLRFRVVSYGKERPVAVCNDISCWSQNRRAVTVLDAGAGS